MPELQNIKILANCDIIFYIERETHTQREFSLDKDTRHKETTIQRLRR